MTQEFHIGDVLSVTTERLVSLRGMAGIYDLLSFMCGESVYTHQLPRIVNEAKPELLRQYPFLAGVAAPNWNDDDMEQVVRAWIDDVAAQHGAYLQHGGYLPVSPLNSDDRAGENNGEEA